MTTQQVTGIILAGGKSSRMQTDKGFVSYRGKLLIEHALDQISPICNEILISANRIEYEQFGYPVIRDTIYDIGPLGGIYSAVQKSSTDLNLIIACDILGVDLSILREMLSTSAGKNIVFLENSSKRIEPLPILIHRQIISEIEMQIEKGDFKLKNLILAMLKNNTSRTACIQFKEQLLNLNTMEDLRL